MICPDAKIIAVGIWGDNVEGGNAEGGNAEGDNVMIVSAMAIRGNKREKNNFGILSAPHPAIPPGKVRIDKVIFPAFLTANSESSPPLECPTDNW